jgi:small subunit ribosomal protein S6
MSAPRQYEIIYIVVPDATEQALEDLHTQIEAIVTRFGARIEKTENWGRRKLAYEIGHHKEGVYVLEQVTGPGEMIKEIDRRLRVVDQVIRHLVVRIDEEMKVAERRRSKRTAHQERRRAARGLPPEEEAVAGGARPETDEGGGAGQPAEEAEVES